jgi:hypothetical protein
MNKKLTWEQIRNQYPDQWVSIIEPELSDEEGFKGGVVVAFDKDKKAAINKTKELRKQGLKYKMHSFRYTGEIPYIVGMAKLTIEND